VIKSAQNSASVSRWATPQLSGSVTTAAPAVEDMAQVRQNAFDQGHAEGYKAGMHLAEEELRARFVTLEQLLAAISRPLGDLDEEVLGQLAQLAGRIARQLVKRELRTEPETIMALVRDSVAILNSTDEKIRIHLHPDDARVIHGLTQAATEKNRWDIVEDPLIAHGDCNVISFDSIISGDLQTRINAIIWQCLGDDRG
jgi:flagellar assembly protein FliH